MKSVPARYLFALFVLLSFMLVGCAKQSATGNVVAVQAPVKSCTINGFTCYPQARGDTEMVLTLTNRLGYTLSGSATLTTSDCTLTKSLDSFYAPKEASFDISFSCNKPLPPSLSGTLTLSYPNNGKTETKSGTIVYRHP